MNKPKHLDNRTVSEFLQPYLTCAELVDDYPRMDDIFSGALAAKTPGDSSTRTLSRGTLFHVLRACADITTAEVERVTHGRYKPSTLAAYAGRARLASLAIARYVEHLPPSSAATHEWEEEDAAEALPAIDASASASGAGYDPLSEMGPPGERSSARALLESLCCDPDHSNF